MLFRSFPPVGQPWDSHSDSKTELEKICGVCDLPVAGFIRDLKSRGLMDSTLVLWTGEFGRLPVTQTGAKPGRDHNPNAFTVWMAGGGVKGGTMYGATDEVGLKAAENRVSVHDLHATILHLLGLDHKKLTYRYNGRDYRLTDVFGNVVKEVIS